MATRRIIDITKDGEKVWPKGHAKATFMSDGRSVEDAINEIPIGGEGGSITSTEIEAMGFTKNQGTITGIKMNGASKGTSGVVDLGTVITVHQDISGKVDKVAGKGLSTNDFTNTAKDQLDGLVDWYAGADTDIAYLMSNSAKMYKTEFDINDLYAIYNDQTHLVSCGKDEIVQAIKLGKVVCVPYSKDDLSLGYIIADAIVEDLLYIDLMGTNGDFFSIGTDYTQSGLFAEDIIYHSFHKKQDKLISGTNIKTINGQSLIDEGDLQTQYSILELKSSSVAIAPNVYNILPEDTQYDVSFGEGIDGVVNEYVFQCVAKNGGTLVLPDSVIWANGEIPPMTAGKIYVVSIVNNLAVYAEF